MAIKVFKFGGALLNKSDGFAQLKEIINANYNATNKLILVISAFEKTTTRLFNAALTAETTNTSAALEILNDIFDYHYNIANNIIKTNEKKAEIKEYIKQQHDSVSYLLRGISVTKELTARTKDLVLSTGEMLATNIVTIFLSEYFDKAEMFDITKVLITNETFGAATPDLELTQRNIKIGLGPALERSNIIVTQGFIAKSYSGEITTMGYESSNLSATILAGLTVAEEFVIWTDTQGIRQFDPKKSKQTTPKLISNMDYNTAEFLANSGLKLIYPKMIKYLQMFDIEVKFKSGYFPDGEHTIIGKNDNFNDTKTIITCNNLASYSKVNTNGQYDLSSINSDVFLSNKRSSDKNIVEDYTNTIYISPDEKILISSSNLPDNILQTLNYNNITKKDNIILITLLNYSSQEILQIISQLTTTMQNKINNIFINNKKQVIRIILENDTELENVLEQALIEII